MFIVSLFNTKVISRVARTVSIAQISLNLFISLLAQFDKLKKKCDEGPQYIFSKIYPHLKKHAKIKKKIYHFCVTFTHILSKPNVLIDGNFTLAWLNFTQNLETSKSKSNSYKFCMWMKNGIWKHFSKF